MICYCDGLQVILYALPSEEYERTYDDDDLPIGFLGRFRGRNTYWFLIKKVLVFPNKNGLKIMSVLRFIEAEIA